MSVHDPLLYILEEAGRSTRWNFPLAVGAPVLDFGGLGTAVALTYSFMADLPDYEAAADHPGFTSLDAAMQAGARRALAAWSAVANVGFTEVADAGEGGQLRFGREAMADSGGYAYPPSFAYGYDPATTVVTAYNPTPWMGDIYISTATANDSMAAGAYGYHVLVHEIGHALGLKHPFEPTNTLDAAEANLRFTVMAYDIPAGYDNVLVNVTGDASSYSWTIEDIYPSTPMLYDVAALQYLYGANTATNGGDTTYAWATDARLLETLWDGGGSDTIDTANQTLPSIIDLRDGAYSSIAQRLTVEDRRLEIPAFAAHAPTPAYTGTDNLAIAFGAVIEHARGGSGSDRIIGNAVANRLEGGGGDDTLEGGSGADSLAGGSGDDSYLVDGQTDIITEAAAEGTDGVTASASFQLSAEVENLTLGSGAGGILGLGNGLANGITGNEAANLIDAAAGNDSVAGGGGADLLYGDDGEDSLAGEAGNDVLAGGAGGDTLSGGPGSDMLDGAAGDDRLAGGSDFVLDRLEGGDGNDTLDAASGLGDADQLQGGAGDDSFLVDAQADLVIETADAGTDTVFASIAEGGYYLGEAVENLTLLGATLFGVGNGLANTVSGNAGANTLLGGAGPDTLNGAEGNDLLYGEAGSDRFVLERGTGGEVIGDFRSGIDQLLLVGLGLSGFAAVQAAILLVSGDGWIDFGQGDSVLLSGVASLGPQDVAFA